MRSRHSLLIVALLLLVAAADGYIRDNGTFVPESNTSQLASLFSAYATGTVSLLVPTKHSDCEVRGPLPDPRCSPGSVFEGVTLHEMCVPGYSASVRNVSTATKQEVYAEYGIAYPEPRGSYEVDHIIPLALGGSNDVANLFPQAGEPTPGFHEKDIVEDYLHEEVCAGHIDLAAAQKQIATNWVAVYQLLPPEQILAIKQKYQSWAN